MDGIGGQVGPQNPADSGQADAFDKFECRAAERIPRDFLREGAGESGHGSSEGRMGGSGHVLLAVGKARIGGEAGAKFNKVA